MMSANETTSTPNSSAAYNHAETHPVFPAATHDEKARFDFLANLTRYISSVALSGNRIAFERRVKPRFDAQSGRTFQSRDEVNAAMQTDPQYQMWGALQRASTEMRQQAGRSLVLRQLDQLAQTAQTYTNQRPETMQLDPTVSLPEYMMLIDIHGLPGSYYTEYVPNDVGSAAAYDASLSITSDTHLGGLSDGAGRSLVSWLRQNYPDFQPQQILDIGSGSGNNTLPLAVGYPDAQVTGLDISAPMIRYSHARSVALNVPNVRFRQADAEQLPFADNSIDWVQTTFFLQETSRPALDTIIREIYRVLKPGGLVLHIEQMPFTPDMPLFDQCLRDWDANQNNLPFWAVMHDMDVRTWMTDAGFNAGDLLQFGVDAIDQKSDFARPRQVSPHKYVNSAVWNVFGGWKHA